MSHAFSPDVTSSSASGPIVDRLATRVPRTTAGQPLPPNSARALALWPGLDRARLLRTNGDPARIAALVAPRTVHSPEHVIAMLTRDQEPRP